MSIAEHSDRRNHHQQPRRPGVNHWGKDSQLHPGADPAACPICHPKEARA